MKTQTDSPTTGLWCCKQAASYLSVSERALWKMCRDGRLPHVRLSPRCYRVRKSDLDGFIASRTR